MALVLVKEEQRDDPFRRVFNVWGEALVYPKEAELVVHLGAHPP
jgi:hypothetical protein